jgi:hypothetical protein
VDFVSDSTVNKLILLFMLEKMEIPLTENSILEICTNRNSWLNYMDCKEIIWQLLESNFIYKTSGTEPDNTYYGLNETGMNCLAQFFLKIPASLREDIVSYAKENRMNYKRSQEYVSDFKKNDEDGSYTAILKIIEPRVSTPLLELKIKTQSRNSAKIIAKKWHDKAPEIFENIFETLIDE